MRHVKKNAPMRKSIFSADQKRLQALLRQVRVSAGLSQQDLAEHLGKPQSFVSKYEQGERRLDLLELRHICLGIGVSLLEFVRRFEEGNR